MLKTIKVSYLITNFNEHKNIIKTFNKISQKFGHVNLIGDGLFKHIPLLNELIQITKRYNNKLTIHSDLFVFDELLHTSSKQLNDIFEHIDVLGLNINSPINKVSLLKSIIQLAQHYNTTVHINTVLNQENAKLDFFSNIKEINYSAWYAYTNDPELFKLFSEMNKNHVITQTEDYYHILTNGTIVNAEDKIISSINKPSNEIYRDLINYNPHLKNQIKNINFNYSLDYYYLEKVSKIVKSGKAIFFDIEAVSRESTNSMKHHLKDYPIPILYALLKIDFKTLKVVDRSSFTVTNVSDLHTIYMAFLDYIKSNQIEYIIVSNGDLEKRFIDNCMIYLKSKLKLEDFRYLFKLRDHIIDIQKIIDKQMNSFKLLQELSINYPDLITFDRKTTKLSFKINFLLDGLIFGPKHHEQGIQKIIDYCFEDVYADFELFKFYDFIYNHNLTK